MSSGHQFSLALIPHKVEDTLIEQRSIDGYINATAMCKAVGKQFNDYTRLAATTEFVNELSAETGIPVSVLIQSLRGGSDPSAQGSWVHPDLAVHLAQWLSPKFAVMVSKWVREWLSGGRYGGGAMPYHVQRYMANRTKVPFTHFSVLNELTMNLIAPLESRGYRLPENMVPDISQGKMFAKWLRDEKEIDTDSMSTYQHEYADGRVCQAKLYPIALLEDFRRHFNETWMPTKALDYFRDRDPNALPYLDQVLAMNLEMSNPPAPALPAPRKSAAKKKPGIFWK